MILIHSRKLNYEKCFDVILIITSMVVITHNLYMVKTRSTRNTILKLLYCIVIAPIYHKYVHSGIVIPLDKLLTCFMCTEHLPVSKDAYFMVFGQILGNLNKCKKYF